MRREAIEGIGRLGAEGRRGRLVGARRRGIRGSSPVESQVGKHCVVDEPVPKSKERLTNRSSPLGWKLRK